MMGYSDRFTRLALRERWEYARYRLAQIRQTRAKRHKDASFRIRPFATLVRERCPHLGHASHVLSLGPRNDIEIQILESLGLGRVTGLDLWPASRRIRRGDMHKMPFPDEQFDLVFASHVFEHAYDFGTVAAECLRVLRRPGLVFAAVPTNFTPNDHDRTLFRSAEDLVARFRPARPEVLYASENGRELVVLFRLDGAGR